MQTVTISMMIDSMSIAAPSANPVAKPHVANRKQKENHGDCHKDCVAHKFTPAEFSVALTLGVCPAFSTYYCN
jgi:hypothetical protein